MRAGGWKTSGFGPINERDDADKRGVVLGDDGLRQRRVFTLFGPVRRGRNFHREGFLAAVVPIRHNRDGTFSVMTIFS